MVAVVSMGLLTLPSPADEEGLESAPLIKWCIWEEPLGTFQDPNWNPAACFVPAWSSVKFESTLSNPNENVFVGALKSNQSLTIRINMHKAVCDGLISELMFLKPLTAMAIDEQDSILEIPFSSSLTRYYDLPNPSISSFPDSRPPSLWVTFHMDPYQEYPLMFKTLDFSLNMLTADSFEYAALKAPPDVVPTPYTQKPDAANVVVVEASKPFNSSLLSIRLRSNYPMYCRISLCPHSNFFENQKGEVVVLLLSPFSMHYTDRCPNPTKEL